MTEPLRHAIDAMRPQVLSELEARIEEIQTAEPATARERAQLTREAKALSEIVSRAKDGDHSLLDVAVAQRLADDLSGRHPGDSDSAFHDLVEDARWSRATWDVIGAALRLTRTGAREKFARSEAALAPVQPDDTVDYAAPRDAPRDAPTLPGVSLAEAAAELGISEAALRKRVRAGLASNDGDRYALYTQAVSIETVGKRSLYRVLDVEALRL